LGLNEQLINVVVMLDEYIAPPAIAELLLMEFPVKMMIDHTPTAFASAWLPEAKAKLWLVALGDSCNTLAHGKQMQQALQAEMLVWQMLWTIFEQSKYWCKYWWQVGQARPCG